MPTYEYRCRSCDQHVEVVQAFTDDSLTTCDACGGDLRKVFASVGISFKGSGFYKNDSRGKSSSSTTTGDSGSSSSDKGDSSSSGSPDKSDSSSSGSSDKAASTSDKPAKKDSSKSSSTPASASPAKST